MTAMKSERSSAGCVLVVDDSPTVRTLLTTILRGKGYKVFEAECADEALALITGVQPDVLITDVEMPGMNGIGLCRQVQALSGQPIHIIILSKRSDTVVDGLDAGAADYIAKPFAAFELLARVSSGMRIVRQQKEILENSQVLRRSYDAVRADHDRLGADLSAAAELQSGLLPPPVSRCEGMTVSCAVQPSSFLSGDIVGMLPRRSGEIAVYSVDVAGKGTPAALLATAIAQELNRARGWQAPGAAPVIRFPTSASDIVTQLNARFVDFANSDRYSTMAYAVLNRERARAEVCVAGHPKPAIVSSRGDVRFIGDGGFPVGLLAAASYKSEMCSFGPSDRLVLYSDGFIESKLPGGELLGYQGMAELLRSLSDFTVETLAPAMVEALGVRVGRDVGDDVSVIAAAHDIA